MSLPIAGGAALNLLPEDPQGPLTSNSSLIQETRKKLQTLFFKEGSVLFVSEKEGGLSPDVYPSLNTVYIKSDTESTVQLSIGLCEVKKSRFLVSCYLDEIQTSMTTLLMTVKTHNPLQNIILSTIYKEDYNYPIMQSIITFQQFIQFVSSLLYLYKDVINYIQITEEDLSSKRLRKICKNLLIPSHLEYNGNALRELLISQSKELSLGLVTRSFKESLIEDMRLEASCYENELEIKLLDIISNHGSKDDMVRLMINVSIQDYKTCTPPILSFISQCVTYSMWQCILMNRSEQDAIEIFKLIPRVMLREMSQDMLKSILIKISKEELVNIIIKLLPIRLLQNVLIKLCPDLLRKVLLDMPKNLLMSFQDELQGLTFVKKYFKERILELGQIKNMHQGLQEDNIPTVPSLLVLSATTICRSSSLSLGGAQGLGGWPYTPLYVNKLLETYPKLKEDINRVGRMSIEPSLEGVLEIIFGESQSPEYSEEDDLLSLASMIPGYDNYIKHALLKNAK